MQHGVEGAAALPVAYPTHAAALLTTVGHGIADSPRKKRNESTSSMDKNRLKFFMLAFAFASSVNFGLDCEYLAG